MLYVMNNINNKTRALKKYNDGNKSEKTVYVLVLDCEKIASSNGILW